MIGTVWLVRHAATEWTGRRWCGRSDPDLSSAGLAGARRVADELAASSRGAGGAGAAGVVLTSPLRRAAGTGRVIAAALGWPLVAEEALTEVDLGAADGLTWDELVAAHPSVAAEVLAAADVNWPGGETAGDVRARARIAADRILESAADGPVVAVSHGLLLRAVAPLIGVAPIGAPLEPGAAIRADVGWPR